jgi:hypothetical protein
MVHGGVKLCVPAALINVNVRVYSHQSRHFQHILIQIWFWPCHSYSRKTQFVLEFNHFLRYNLPLFLKLEFNIIREG